MLAAARAQGILVTELAALYAWRSKLDRILLLGTKLDFLHLALGDIHKAVKNVWGVKLSSAQVIPSPHARLFLHVSSVNSAVIS